MAACVLAYVLAFVRGVYGIMCPWCVIEDADVRGHVFRRVAPRTKNNCEENP
jgi:hypothetical protein